MKNKIRDFLLRALPYLASIAGGVLLFSVSLDNVKDPAIEALISNISASLLAIPLVFLLYDYTTTRVSRRLRETMITGMNDKINTIILHLALTIGKIMKIRGRMNRQRILAMRAWSESYIERTMQIHSEYIDLVHQYYGELENIIMAFSKENAMSPETLRIMTILAREMSRMVAMHKLGGNRRIVARHLKNIVGEINDWLDFGANVSADFDKILDESTSTAMPDTKNATAK